MRRILLTLLLAALSITNLPAKELKNLLASGNNVYIEAIDIKDNIEDEYGYFVKHLKDNEEWGRWNIVESSSEANFTCRLTLDNRLFLGTGGAIHAYIEILDNQGEVIWKSKTHKGMASTFTGYNAHGDAMRKIIRRAIKKELYKE